jgi:hypothetical protein
VTASSRLPGEPCPAARPAAGRCLVLVLDPDPDRVHAAARAVRTAGGRVRVHDATDTIESGGDADPDVILVRAEPGSWSAAAALAAHHPRQGRPVDAFLVTEGPLERFSTLITDFPGLRLLPPGAAVGSLLAELG